MADFTSLNGYDVKDKIAREQLDILGKSNYYDEITYSKERHYDTDCYFINIPKLDNNGEIIKPYVAKHTGISPTEYARENYTSLTINAGLTQLNNDGVTWKQAIVIGNGEILNTYEVDHAPEDYMYYIGFTANREVRDYLASDVSAEYMLNDGIENAFLTFYRLIKNSEIITHSDVENATRLMPRIDLGVKNDGTIVLLACDGRTNINRGITSEESSTLLLQKGCINAWCLDGGGSTSVTINGSKFNRNIDENGTVDRNIDITLNFKKETSYEEIAKLYSKIGEEKQNLIQMIMPTITNAPDIKYATGIGVNDLTDKWYHMYIKNCYDTPSSPETGFFINIPHGENSNTSVQIWVNNTTNQSAIRTCYEDENENKVFTGWKSLNDRYFRLFQGYNMNTLSSASAQTMKYANLGSNNNFIVADSTTMVDGRYTHFKINYVGWVTILYYLEMEPQVTGNKIIKVVKNDVDNGDPLNSMTNKYMTANQHNNMFGFATFENDSVDNKYSLSLTGGTGDVTTRIKIKVQID